MAKVTVYPHHRWDITHDMMVPGNTFCRLEYFEDHKGRQPLLGQGVEVDESLLDGDGCVPVSKLPKA